jgi:hypothetical protein
LNKKCSEDFSTKALICLEPMVESAQVGLGSPLESVRADVTDGRFRYPGRYPITKSYLIDSRHPY